MSDSFRRKEIAIGIKLSQGGTVTNQPGTFAGTGADQITIRGRRTSCRVQFAGGASGSMASVTVWGLDPSTMNQLSTLGMAVTEIEGNALTISASEEGGQPSTVFTGTIFEAIPEYSDQPSTPMRFICKPGALAGMLAFPATSYSGKVKVSDVLSTLAASQQWGFENSGVDTVISNPYLTGSPLNQIKQIARDTNIQAVLINNILCIWPSYGSRRTQGNTPLISAETGMIGYPSYTKQGLLVRSIFRPEIGLGAPVRVVSDILTSQNLARVNNATGLWTINRIDLSLDSETPNGLWEQQIYCYTATNAAGAVATPGGL